MSPVTPRSPRLWYSLRAFGVSARIQAGRYAPARARLRALRYTDLERVHIFESITETDAEKFVVHIHVNLARKECHLSVIFVKYCILFLV